ncbi:MAG: M23 family metallopeptidase [Desulfohalobiaceae bacterium]
MERQSGKGKILGILVLILLVCASGLYFLVADREKPSISLGPDAEYMNGEASVEITVRDSASGVAHVRVAALQEDEEKTLLEATPGGSPEKWSESLPVAETDLEEGSFRLVVSALDSSWGRFFQGRQASAEREYVLDTTPPRISLESFRHNLKRGGSGLAAFRVQEEPQQVGISVGDAFFPAYRQENGIYLGLFTHPYEMEAQGAQALVVARDRADNVQEVSLRYSVKDKRFPRKRIRISESFLNRNMPSFQQDFPGIEDKLELFVAVNEKLRDKNRATIRGIGREATPQPLWRGRFLRQPDSARQSSFAVKRDYYYNGDKISQSTHQGIDLASVARARVPASNVGKVVHADRLGIYGKAVIIDHGLGLQSLYGHLSEIVVEKGQRVDKGDVLGRTGATGLAGGDHLHFEMMISGIPVSPVEWWDGSWIEKNIGPKAEKARAQKEEG